MNPKRIGLIYHQFVPKGGLERYLIEFAEHLAAAGHGLTAVTSAVTAEVQRSIPAQWHMLPLVSGSALLRMWQFENRSRQWDRAGVDVTIGFGRTTSHDLHRAGGGCHAEYSRLLPPWKRWGPKNLLELDLEKQLYTSGRTKLFVVNSAQVGRQLATQYGVAENRFRVIHTAVDTEKFLPALERDQYRAKICAKMGTDPQRSVFVFVSLSHRRKGLDVLLDVWPEVDAELWIVGKPLKGAYLRKVRSRSLAGKVRSLAVQSDIRLLYQVGDWFIHPTLYDACANTVLQSMACGLPGLISARDGVIDHIKDGENGLLLREPEDRQAVLSTIQQALRTSTEKRHAMSEAARRAMLPLTWPAHLDKWMQAIGEVTE